MVQKLPKSYIIRLFRKPPRSKAPSKCLLHRDDGSYTPYSLRLCASLDACCYAPCYAERNARRAIVLGSLTSKLADSLCVDYLSQVTTPWLVWLLLLQLLSKRLASNCLIFKAFWDLIEHCKKSFCENLIQKELDTSFWWKPLWCVQFIFIQIERIFYNEKTENVEGNSTYLWGRLRDRKSVV